MQLHVARRGRGEPLLLIQGLSGTHASWGEPFLAALEDGLDCVAYDHRGIGQSDRVRGAFTIADLADDAAGLLDRLGLESVHVVGISMGGMVAQELALRHPTRLRTMTLGCTTPGGPRATYVSPDDAQMMLAALQSGDRERALRASFELNTSAAFHAEPANWPAFRDMVLAVPTRLPVIMAQMQALYAHDVVDRLAEIDLPTLVVHGTEDRMLPVGNADILAAGVPGARLELLEGAGHMFWWERPADASRLVREHVGVGAAA